MEISRKIEINKKIKSYDGDNSFILSLKKQLKSNKYLSVEEFGNKKVRVLSQKQYDIAISILEL
jgi:hypothetical protein